MRAIEKYGVGAGASRLICGNNALYKILEERLAQFKKTEGALVFSSGYTANVGTISAMASKESTVFSDRLNHASIVDGIILSRARHFRYPHADTAALEGILSKNETEEKLIVTDTVFSVDGDIAPLAQIVSLAKKYNAFLMVDEAHATGVLGEDGAGAAHKEGIDGSIDIQMGTLSKALGGLGGFVCARKEIIDYLMNKSRSFIYTTALPPSVLASNIAALDIIQNEPELRKALWKNAAYLSEGLHALGFDTLNSKTPIIPVLLKDNELTMNFSNGLFEEGIFAIGIRPPTVPIGSARLRVTVTAAHKREHLDKALEAFAKVGKRLGVVSI